MFKYKIFKNYFCMVNKGYFIFRKERIYGQDLDDFTDEIWEEPVDYDVFNQSLLEVLAKEPKYRKLNFFESNRNAASEAVMEKIENYRIDIFLCRNDPKGYLIRGYNLTDLSKIQLGIINFPLSGNDYLSQISINLNDNQQLAFYYGIGHLTMVDNFPKANRLNKEGTIGLLNYFIDVFNPQHPYKNVRRVSKLIYDPN